MDALLLGLRVALALASVLGLIWFAGRKLAGTAGVRRTRSVPLAVIGRQSLGKGAGVALVEVAGRVLLLGVGDQGVRVLTEIDVPAADGADDGAAAPAADAPRAVAGLGGVLVPVTEVREELDLSVLEQDPTALDDPERVAELAALAGLAASTSARRSGALQTGALQTGAPTGARQTGARQTAALQGSILSPETWRRAVDVVQQRTVRR
ncbi:flagellar biosynthetic protein FliO [Cellulomonas fimi]|uniref:Flagellar biosynthetic protein FliO n=1 Tax=Cellulomonas fimi TaxID=1708 RepID=A0A7Y0M049_CELFI|nr:flagellar biosynthetic protein FliO [Cellulomonas fimi]NMR21065.1 flagellar biosynthetic protein FliO [Cellulomonas fimi]